jgi:4-hydroxybenzoate polyprenyltransferase
MTAMKFSRLFQPRNPIFWIMVALNALSAALAWIVQNRPLNAFATIVVGIFALSNALIGTWLLWRLLKDDPQAAKN